MTQRAPRRAPVVTGSKLCADVRMKTSLCLTRALPRLLCFVVVMLLWPDSSLANTPTTVMVRPEAPGDAYVARYSQAVLLSARLLDDSGAPVAGRRVSFFLQHQGEESSRFLIFDPFTAADGVAQARLVLTAGSHGQADFLAGVPGPDSDGEPYEVIVRFAGDVAADDPACAVDAGVLVDGGVPADGGEPEVLLCPSEDTLPLYLAVETTTLVVAPGNDGALGSALTLIATLTDPNGDAPQEGDAVDGTEPKGIEGASVDFFYDLDQNGSPSLNERIGTATTNRDGQAVIDFVADPAVGVVAGLYDRGIHAQFGGDERYGLSGGAAALTITPGEPDATRTLLTADVTEVPADGFSEVAITATLVDVFNNPIGVDAPPADVSLTTSLGEIVEPPELDLLTGDYHAVFKAGFEAGTATVQVVVNGEPGATLDITLLEQPFCNCDAASNQGWPPAAVGIAALGLLLRRRRRKQGGAQH